MIPCGHDIMLDLPDELTALLLEYASLKTGSRTGASRR